MTIYIVSLGSESAPRLMGIDPEWIEAALAEICRRPSFIGMAAQDGDGAFCGYILGDGMEDEAEIIHLAVAASHRRRGIAKRLLMAFMEGKSRCFLEVRADNEAAIGLYESAGFRVTGRREGYYDGTDGLRMTYQAP